MYYLYILESETNGKLYIGQTNNLEERVSRHNAGRNEYTRNRGPWKLIYSRKLETRTEAVLLEAKLKSWKNPGKVKEWISGQSG